MPDRKGAWFADEAIAMTSWNNVLIMVWGTEMRLEHIQEIRRQNDRMLQQGGYSTGFGITIFTPSFALPGAAVRTESEKLGRELLPMSLGSANVVQGEGLRPATIRTVLSAVLMVSRSNKPNKVFSHIQEGVEWMLTVPGIELGTGNAYQSCLESIMTVRKLFP
jgi:hypothetical protein